MASEPLAQPEAASQQEPEPAEPQEAQPEVAPQEPEPEAPQEEPAAEAQEAEAQEPESAPAEPEKPKAPEIPREFQEARANWEAAQKIFEADPELHKRAIETWKRLQQGPPQTPKAEQTMEWAEAKKAAAQLREQGRAEEADELLIANHPSVVKANQTLAQWEASQAAERAERAAQDIRTHFQKFGEPDATTRAAMKDLYNRGFTGDLVKARIAALHEQGRHQEAFDLSQKAPAAPQAAGGRVPASRGAPAPRRVSKEKPTEGAGIDLDYVQRREAEQKGRE